MTWIENIQTLSKYSQQSREVSFTLIGRNLEWNRGFHSDLLRDNYGLPGNLATVLRHYLPRGAAVEDIEDGFIVEASEELRPYASEIANQLNINPMRIGFDNVHYEVRTETQWAFDNIEGWLVYEEDEALVERILSFVKSYLPNIYATVRHFDRKEETLASSTWFQKVCSNVYEGELSIRALIPEICRQVQTLYDQWNQSDSEYGDPELGFGGICQEFAEAMADVLNSNGIEATTISAQCGEQHVWVVAQTPDGVYEVDIPFHFYETGGGYNWQKIEGVKFDENYVHIDIISHDPSDFSAYLDGGE